MGSSGAAKGSESVEYLVSKRTQVIDSYARVKVPLYSTPKSESRVIHRLQRIIRLHGVQAAASSLLRAPPIGVGRFWGLVCAEQCITGQMANADENLSH